MNMDRACITRIGYHYRIVIETPKQHWVMLAPTYATELGASNSAIDMGYEVIQHD